MRLLLANALDDLADATGDRMVRQASRYRRSRC
jgi:hypothetical protein